MTSSTFLMTLKDKVLTMLSGNCTPKNKRIWFLKNIRRVSGRKLTLTSAEYMRPITQTQATCTFQHFSVHQATSYTLCNSWTKWSWALAWSDNSQSKERQLRLTETKSWQETQLKFLIERLTILARSPKWVETYKQTTACSRSRSTTWRLTRTPMRWSSKTSATITRSTRK